MGWFKNRKTMAKLMIGFMTLVAVMIGIGVYGLIQMGAIQDELTEMYELQLQPIVDLGQMRVALNRIRASVLNHILADTKEEMKEFEKEIEEEDQEIEKEGELYAKSIRTEEGQALYNDFLKALKDYEEIRSAQVLTLSAAGKKEKALEAAGGPVKQRFTAAAALLGKLSDIKSKLAKDSFETADQHYSSTRNLTVATLVIATVLSVFLGLMIGRMIARPLGQSVEVLLAVAGGDYTKRLDIDTQDEVGQMAGALNKTIEAIRTSFQQLKEAGEREKQQAEDLRGKVDSILAVVDAASKGDLTREVTVKGADAVGRMGEGLGKFFGDLRRSIGSIGQTAMSVGAASEELTATSQQMGASAEETSAQANVVSAASEQVSKNVQTVAAGSVEMSASIKEISKNTSEAAKVANAAVKVAETTNATISKLGDSSAEIGKVIKVITSIAEQTNLLALNATIEAARAGEAGKGFAVVANEVKELAKETAKATEDISQKIEAIQNDTKGAVDAIGQISGIINQINDIQNVIAAAVEEQTATTNEIGRNVSEAAKGTSEIAQNITGVATAARTTTQGAADTQKAASELSRMSAEMQQLVSQFKV